MKLALITLSAKGLGVALKLKSFFADAEIYLHKEAQEPVTDIRFERFAKTALLSRQIFDAFQGLVYIMPCGVVVRALAPLVKSKFSDPAVVVVDVGGRWLISLLGGHEGGANRLAEKASWVLDGEPIVSTSSEAEATIIAGIGCRRGVSAAEIVDALRQALRKVGADLKEVRLLASVDLKRNEIGLLQAAEQLNLGLRFIGSSRVRETGRFFSRSAFVKKKVDLPAVAEPAALLGGSRTCLILNKQVYGRVTVALARESSF